MSLPPPTHPTLRDRIAAGYDDLADEDAENHCRATWSEPDMDHAEPDHHHVPTPGAKPTPAPGSPEAIALMCSCPVLDNGHGRGSRYGAGVFVMSGDCPLHGTGKPAGAGEE